MSQKPPTTGTVTVGFRDGTVYAEVDTTTLEWPYLSEVHATQAQLAGTERLTSGSRGIRPRLEPLHSDLPHGVIIKPMRRVPGRQWVIEVNGVSEASMHVAAAAVILLLDLILTASRDQYPLTLRINWSIDAITRGQSQQMRRWYGHYRIEERIVPATPLIPAAIPPPTVDPQRPSYRHRARPRQRGGDRSGGTGWPVRPGTPW